MSNTWITYPKVGDNQPKGWLIPHKTTESVDSVGKAGDFFGSLAPKDGSAAHQVVGEVMAHQALDG